MRFTEVADSQLVRKIGVEGDVTRGRLSWSTGEPGDQLPVEVLALVVPRHRDLQPMATEEMRNLSDSPGKSTRGCARMCGTVVA